MTTALEIPEDNASFRETCLSTIGASWPSIPSADTTNGEKWHHCSKQAWRYLTFFSFSCAARTDSMEQEM
eukprot:7390306-Ditylum_brightwellii.AAC.1